MKKDKLDKFIIYRNKLIEKLDLGKIDKKEFIKKNYEYISEYKINPYDEIETISQGTLAYQFFNSTAKYLLTKAFEIEFKNPKRAYQLREEAFENYAYKNNVIKKILILVDYKNVEAFFINMNSKVLEGELFEIILKDYEKMIFHTKDKLIKNRLKKHGCFSESVKESVISKYINNKY